MSMLYKILLYSTLASAPLSGFCSGLPQLPQIDESESSQNVGSLPVLPTLGEAKEHTKPSKQVISVKNNTTKSGVSTNSVTVDTHSAAATPVAPADTTNAPTATTQAKPPLLQAVPASSPAMKYMGPGPVVISKPKPNNAVAITPVAPTDTTKVPTATTQAKPPLQAVPASSPAMKYMGPGPVVISKPKPNNAVATTPVAPVGTTNAPTATTQAKPVQAATNKVSSKVSNQNVQPNQQNSEIDEERATYINNEAIMLTIGDDDVVLGKTTHGALIDNMPAKEYIHELLDGYESSTEMMKKREITFFIDGRKIYRTKHDINLEEIKEDLFESIKRSRIDDARIILDNTHLLQSRNKSGQNLLGVAVLTNDTNVAKFLLHRGVNMNAIDYEGDTPMNIAEDIGHTKMQKLLNRAFLVPKYKSY